jgi:(p)ppGpp synthase/HD superfamily hydrolase
MSEVDRLEAMAVRLTDTFLHSGLSSIDVDRVLRAYRLAMERRRGLPEDHPMALHPARTVLILFHDCGIKDPVILSAAAAIDSSASKHSVPADVVAAELGERVAELSEAVPVPDEAGDELLEQMLTAEPEVQFIALAERLDFARHLHLLPGENWAREHELVRLVYLPVALRADPMLGRRFSRWADSFGRRRL